MRYRIWERFSPEARRAAATAAYEVQTGVRGRCTVEGSCPLGIAMTADRIPSPTGEVWWSSPEAFDIADAFTEDDIEPGWEHRRADIRSEALAFYRDWDEGRIGPTDLLAVLEVTA